MLMTNNHKTVILRFSALRSQWTSVETKTHKIECPVRKVTHKNLTKYDPGGLGLQTGPG